MNVSFNWLKDYIDTTLTASEIALLFTKHSQEVAGVKKLYQASNIKIGKVLSVEKISPEVKNQKCLVEVEGIQRQIVCGAPNVKAGQDVLVADIGAELPGGLKIQKAVINGVESEGMICSLSELGIDKKYINEEGIHALNLDETNDLDLDDEIIELELTPNRMDLMSILGVAYDLKAMTGTSLKLPKINVLESLKENPYTIEIESTSCDYYAGRVIENVTIKESPEWLKNRLMASGIRPINNVVDITNYVMIDLGQPLHAFDHDTLKTNKIVVRDAKENESFITLDNQERSLKEGDVLITNGIEPVALGGVMGGLETEVTASTQTIFLESACFNPVQIGKTSRRLDLRSEASLRFERGIAHDRTKLALDKAAFLIQAYAGGEILKGIKEANVSLNQPTLLSVRSSRINRLLGTRLSSSVIALYLEKLSLEYKINDDIFEIVIPERRLDLKTEQDMAEEIGRLMGYDQLEATLPRTITKGGLSHSQKLRRKIKNSLQGLGLNEVVTYSLTRPDKETPFINNANKISVLRPLSEENVSLKQTTVVGLLEVLKYHQSRQMSDVMIYEWRHLYKEKEENTLGLAFMGNMPHPLFKKPKIVDFYDAKGIAEHVLKILGLNADFIPLEKEGFHPYQSALIKVNEHTVGYGGKIHPDVARSYDLNDAFVFELNIDQCLALKDKETMYEPIVRMPSVKRDISLIMDKTVKAATVLEVIYKTNIKAISDVYVFDIYEGTPLKETEKSVAFRIWFKPEKETFKTETIDAFMHEILDALKMELGLEIRA